MNIIERVVDPEGRVLLPKEWRKTHGRKVAIIETENYIRIIPMKMKKLSDLFDKAEVKLESKLTDWAEVKKELLLRE